MTKLAERAIPARGLLAAAAILILTSCAAGNRAFDVPPGTEDPLTPARAEIAAGHENSAVLKLTAFLRDNPGSALVDEAKYLRGRTYLAMKDRVLAADDFQRVLSDYPQSRFSTESSYYLAVCYDELSRPSQLDQDWTEKAIGAYRGFVTRYPDRTEAATARERIKALECRLGKKAYENGVLYLRMNAMEAARVYFRKSIEDTPECEWACRSLLGLGETDVKSSRWADAIENLQKVDGICTDRKLRERAAQLLERARHGLAEAPVAPDVSEAPDSSSAH